MQQTKSKGHHKTPDDHRKECFTCLKDINNTILSHIHEHVFICEHLRNSRRVYFGILSRKLFNNLYIVTTKSYIPSSDDPVIVRYTLDSRKVMTGEVELIWVDDLGGASVGKY